MAQQQQQGKIFAGNDFKEELINAADNKMNTPEMAWEQHKEVANDAAILAASKSADFAKAVDKAGVAPPEGIIEVAKERIEEGIDTAKSVLDNAMHTISDAWEGAREKTGEFVEYMTERVHDAEESLKEKADELSLNRQQPSASLESERPLASSEFKKELLGKAEEKMDSDEHAWEQHKATANDAAIMAASKSADFAKAVDKIEAEPEPSLMDMAKEKMEEAKSAMSSAWEGSKEQSAQTYQSGMNKMGGAMEGMKEKAGEAMEATADKMKNMSSAMSDKAEEAKSKGLKLQTEAQLGQAKCNLQPTTI